MINKNKTKLKKSTLQKQNKKKTKKLNKHSNKYDTIYLNNLINKIEFNILITTITDQILFLINHKTPKEKIKDQIILLLKEIRKNNKLIKTNITDNDLTLIFNNIYNYSKYINKQIKQQSLTHTQTNTQTNTSTKTHIKPFKKYNKYNKSKGGFYFKNIEDKGDEPITGNDIVKLLDEMQAFMYNAQYTTEGQFTQDPNLLISLFRGDTDAFKGYLTWRILPKYYQTFPPFIKWDAIKNVFETRKYEDLPDYLLAYQSYQRSRDEYLVEKGLKSPNVLNKDLYSGFYNKLAHSLDQNIQKFQMYRNKLSGQMPLNLPL